MSDDVTYAMFSSQTCGSLTDAALDRRTMDDDSYLICSSGGGDLPNRWSCGSRKFLGQWICVVVLLMSAAGVSNAEDGVESFAMKIRPLLMEHCHQCHGDDTSQAGFVVSTLDGAMNRSGDVAVWKKIRSMVASRAMPPKDADPLSDDEVAATVSWIDEQFRLERERLRTTTPRHVPRRLTSREFNRSLLRLVGAESSLRDFPGDEKVPEDAVEKSGFSNDAQTNPLTKSHLEGLKLASLAALRDFAPFVEKPRSPLRYFYDGEFCYTSRATQDHIFDFVKNVAHPITEVEFQNRREIMELKGDSFLGRPMNKAVFGAGLFPFRPGLLEAFENDLLLANAAAFPASQMYSRGRFTFRVRVRGRAGNDGTLPLMRIKAGYFDVFANHFHTVDSVQISADEQVYEFTGNVRDFPFLDSIPAEHTYRDGNVPKLTSFATNDWGNCMGAFFVVLVENASRHDEGLSLAPGHHRISLGNIHVGSYAEILQRARDKT
ncbi:MAG: c-type cytochrome domain-containing protein, partial [Planctomyces sp.]